MWPDDAEALVSAQLRLADAVAEPWTPPHRPLRCAACWACFPRGLVGPGSAGDAAWAAAVTLRCGQVVDQSVVTSVAGAGYAPGLLALRVGALLERVVRGLTARPDV